jgi:16S rRNA (cytosine967-C5)-methyltransferase
VARHSGAARPASPARRAAFHALRAVLTGRRDSAAALAQMRPALRDPRDHALAAELLLGTLRRQATIDASLAPLVPRGVAALDLEVLIALRLGAYQRLFLDRIPPAAAVSDAVSLVREGGRASAAALVNAVLRRLDPERARVAWPPRPSAQTVALLDAARQAPGHTAPDALRRARQEAADYLSITLSHPLWLVERWMDRHGFDAADQWARFDNGAAPVTLRPVVGRTRDALVERLHACGIETRPGRFGPSALVVLTGRPLQLPPADRALFATQDEASQLVAQLVVDLEPRSVLDTCAAPGGKTSYIRGGAPTAHPIVACDLRAPRLALLAATLEQHSAAGVHVVCADALRAAPFGATFDLVLLDAPCSGLGTIRREPEIRWRRAPDELAALADRQLQMLAHAAACVRPGGRLVYATCSSEPEENEGVVSRFLARAPRWGRLPRSAHPWRGTALEGVLDDAGDLRTLPFRHDLEAFYAAVLIEW